MPIKPTYPGVYIQEVPSGVRTITGVATSVAAFIGFFRRGPMNRAVQILNSGDFEREFGGLDARSEASYAIQQFFANGGTEGWVVRVASDDEAASPPNSPTMAEVEVAAVAGGADVLRVEAINEGAWGNSLRILVDREGASAGEFNLTVSEYQNIEGRNIPVRQEVFRNLSMEGAAANFLETLVNDPNSGSRLIQATATDTNPPLPNGTLSGSHPTPNDVPLSSPSTALRVDVTISSTSPTAPPPVTRTATLNLPLSNTSPPVYSLDDLAPLLESAIRAAAPENTAFAAANVEVVGDQLLVLAGPGTPSDRVVFANATAPADSSADDLRLTAAQNATANVQEYTLGSGAVASSAQVGGTAGADGAPPDATEIIGDLASKTGIYALEDVDLFNLLCIPRAASVRPAAANGLSDTEAQAVLAVAENYCEQRRAFFLMDTPVGIDEPREVKKWLNDRSSLRHRNAALYYPRVQIPDPLNEFRLRSVGASGTIAGLFSRIDEARGVWKAPAGTEASLRNVSQLEYALTDQENGVLNPLGINCLRNFPIYGNVCWGGRTLHGSDQQASEWKYVPIRRLALFLEESLYRGTQWVVFEPNDEPLWAQIRLNLGAFMQSLFRQGAFQGQSPRDAYFVKCDAETTTQNDIDQGIVNIVVGFAPLKPAEFVILKIQQIAGQLQT